MVHRYIILAIVAVVSYFSIWAAECNLGCRPGRYGMHDDTLGAIRLPSSGTIGGSNSMRCFGTGSGTANYSTGGLKSATSFGHVSGPSVDSVRSLTACPVSGPSAGPSSGPSTDPVRALTTDGGGLVLPISKPGKKDRCACEACPCALIEKYVVPVARVGMRSADKASHYFSEVTDRLLVYFGILIAESRTSGRRNAQIIRSRTTLYGESIEEFRLVNNPNFDKNVSINPSVTFALIPTVTSTTHYVKELAQQITVKVSQLSVTLLKKTSDPSVEETEATSELSDKNTKVKIQEPAPDIEKISEIKVKQIREDIDLAAKKSDVSRDLSAHKTEKLSDKIVSEAETISEQTVSKTGTASNPLDKNFHMSATTSKDDHNMLKSPTQQESTECLRVCEIEETIDPELNCSKCVEDGKVCLGGCPSAQMKRDLKK